MGFLRGGLALFRLCSCYQGLQGGDRDVEVKEHLRERGKLRVAAKFDWLVFNFIC